MGSIRLWDVPRRNPCTWLPGTGFTHCGQTALVWKVSKDWPQFPHFQNSPIVGEVLQAGQAKPIWRGNFAKRDSARAWRSPPQQFMIMKMAMAPYQGDCIQKANTMNPAAPIKPRTVATMRLRARPITNQSRDRRIWPPSRG